MTDDTQTWPTGTPDAMGDMAAQLGPSSMCTSPTTDRPKRSISPEDGNRCKRIDSKGTPQKQRGAEMQLVTPQGEEDDVVPRRQQTLPQSLAVELASETSAAAKSAARKKAADARKARYEELNMPYSPVPPLPDGATEDDRERLERAALNRFYGY